MQTQKTFKTGWCLNMAAARRHCLFLLVCAALAGFAIPSEAQNTLNVADYGAVGDAVQISVSTVSNSPSIICLNNIFTTADVGKTVELFGVGSPTSGGNHQDLIATITSVVSGTTVNISPPPSATVSVASGVYGTQNTPAFQAAINASGADTNDTINIPAGTFLLIPIAHKGVYGYSSILLTKGGINFVGAGMTNTVLLSQGAWTLADGANAWRGFLVQVQSPITNDFPVSFASFTMDGGIANGNTANHGFPASTVDGSGWDETHDAYLTSGNSFPTLTHQVLTNVAFVHWRGEIAKSLDANTNGNLQIINCVFGDGNASAINVYPALNITNCVFTNLFQVGEYYQAYSTNTSYFQNNFVTNITGNGLAINGGKGSNPPFVIQNNIFCFSGGDGILTVPADNLLIVSNQFFNTGYPMDIVLGAAGYQGTFDNSNILIEANTFVNPHGVIEFAGGISSTDPQRIEDVMVVGNVIYSTNSPGSVGVVVDYNWAKNVYFYSNSASGQDWYSLNSGAYGSPYVNFGTNNNIWGFPLFDNPDKPSRTNGVSYGQGSLFHLGSAYTNSVFYVSDSDSNQIPAGAQIVINSTCNNGFASPLYLNSAVSGVPLMVTNGQTVVLNWSGSQWTADNSSTKLPPPFNLQAH